MADKTIKNRIMDAMQEPSAPEELVRRTIVRAQLLRAGRNAEEKLAQTGKMLPHEEREQLAAQSLLGRLMLSSLPPEGVSAEKLTAELHSREDIRAALSKPTDVLLSELESGKLIRSLAAKGRARAEKKPEEKALSDKQEKERKTPAKASPVKKAPEIKGPSL